MPLPVLALILFFAAIALGLLAAQIGLPRLAERRIAARLTEAGGTAEVSVRAPVAGGVPSL